MRHSKIPQFAVLFAAPLICLAFVQQPDFPVFGARPPGHPTEVYVPEVDGLETTVFLEGLDIPWSLVFAPDGRMFISERPGTIRAGENGRPAAEPYGTIDVNAEGEGGLMGLAVAPDFADNPFPGSPIYTLGHRNVQGLAWHPQTGALFNSEHGPSGERWTRADGEQVRARAHDEVNVMTAGGNAGWANIVGHGGVEGYIDPILVWPDPAVPPGGMTFYTGELMPQLAGDLFLATLAAEALFRIQFDDPGNPHQPTSVERWFSSEEGRGTFGRLRDVVQGPDGALYLLTNSDRRRRGEDRGRGVIRPEGLDKVLRIAPTGR